jgi:hypothetical protein
MRMVERFDFSQRDYEKVIDLQVSRSEVRDTNQQTYFNQALGPLVPIVKKLAESDDVLGLEAGFKFGYGMPYLVLNFILQDRKLPYDSEWILSHTAPEVDILDSNLTDNYMIHLTPQYRIVDSFEQGSSQNPFHDGPVDYAKNYPVLRLRFVDSN